MSDQVEFLTKQLRFERSRSADEVNRLRAALREVVRIYEEGSAGSEATTMMQEAREALEKCNI